MNKIEKLAKLAAKSLWADLMEALNDPTLDDDSEIEEQMIEQTLLQFRERTEGLSND